MNKDGKLRLSGFKSQSKATVIMTIQQQDRKLDQWKRTEYVKINPHVYGQLVSQKNAKSILWGKNIFVTIIVKTTEFYIGKKMNLDPFSPYIQNYSR